MDDAVSRVQSPPGPHSAPLERALHSLVVTDGVALRVTQVSAQ